MDARASSPTKVRLVLGFSLLWCVLSVGIGLRVRGAVRAALEQSMARTMLGVGALASEDLAPLAPTNLQPDLDGRSVPRRLRRALRAEVDEAGLRDLAVLSPGGLVLCDATGEALPGASPGLDMGAARADLDRGRGHVFPARGRDFGLREQSAVLPLAHGLLLEVDADPRQVRAMESISRGLYACLGGLMLGAGLSLVLALGVLRRERALTQARARAEAVADERVRLAGAIAHESRNTLGAILGQAQWLALRPGLPPESVASAQKIAQQAERLESVMRRLLDFSRPLAPRPVPVSAESLLFDLKADLERSAPGLDVRIRCDPGLSLIGDPELLSAALANFGRNAAEAMDGRGPLLLAATTGEGAWRLEVHDQGPGVPESERGPVFEPFHSGKAEGTGLGLSFALKVARAHGGRAFVVPSELGGACFILEGTSQ